MLPPNSLIILSNSTHKVKRFWFSDYKLLKLSKSLKHFLFILKHTFIEINYIGLMMLEFFRIDHKQLRDLIFFL